MTINFAPRDANDEPGTSTCRARSPSTPRAAAHRHRVEDARARARAAPQRAAAARVPHVASAPQGQRRRASRCAPVGPTSVFDAIEMRSPTGYERLAKYGAAGTPRGRYRASGRPGHRRGRLTVADLRTTITEVVTGLACSASTTSGRRCRPARHRSSNVSPRPVDFDPRRVGRRRPSRRVSRRLDERHAFLDARDALRGRRPRIVEWKGPHKAPGDEVVPADLRVDHVYLVSCKYLSRIVVNASPEHLFDRLLTGGHGQRSGDWFQQVAPSEHAALYTRRARRSRPRAPRDGSRTHRRRTQGPRRFTARHAGDGARKRYEELAPIVARRVGARLAEAITGDEDRCCGGCCASAARRTSCSARRRAARCACASRRRGTGASTSSCGASASSRAPAGSRWSAGAPTCATETGGELRVDGHVEIRWSHGRFCGPPEAKVYLDTPHADVPGYFPLD